MKEKKESDQLRTKWTEIQVRKLLSNSKIDPVKVIAMLLDEKRQEDRIRFAASLCDDVYGLVGMLNISERTYHRRRTRHLIKNVVFKSKSRKHAVREEK